MVLNRLVKFVFHSTFLKTGRSLVNIEIFQVGLNVFVVLDINLLLQAHVVLNQFFFVEWRLLNAQVVHNKEVSCIRFVYTDVIDVVKVRALAVDDIPKMIVLVKYVIARVNKYLELIGDSHFQRYQENLLLLVKDHYCILEFEPTIFGVLQRYSVEPVIGSRLIVVCPNASLLPKNLHNFYLFFQEVRVVAEVFSEYLLALLVKCSVGCFILTTLINFLHSFFEIFLHVRVVEHFSQIVIGFIIIVFFTFIRLLSHCIGCNKRPNYCDDAWTYATLGEKLKLQLFYAKDLVLFLVFGEAVVVQVFVFGLSDLKTYL